MKRLLFLLPFVVVASFGVVPIAGAHWSSATISCTQVTYAFGAFPVGNNLIHEVVTIDNSTVAAADFTLVVTSASDNQEGGNTLSISVPAGTHTVVATASWTAENGGTQTVTQTLSGCQPAPATPALTTTASGPVTVGGAIHDTAHLSGGSAPTGTVSFDVFDAACATRLATVAATAVVNGPGDYVSANFTPTAAGTYKWVAHYSGDSNNSKVDTKCGDAGETSTVNEAQVTPPSGGGETPVSAPAAPTNITTPPTVTPAVTTPAPSVTTPVVPAPVAQPKVKSKPKRFKPPVVKATKKPSPPPCYVVGVGPKALTAGKTGTLELRVTGKNKPISGTKVSIKGAGMMIVSGRTNSTGRVSVTVHPKKAGIVVFRAASHKSCSAARVGVVSAFTPPVTG